MSHNIINAFGRKPGDPLPGAEEQPAATTVCLTSVALLESMLERAKAGALEFVGVIGIADGSSPIVALPRVDEETVGKIALLNIATDQLKGMVFARLDDFLSNRVLVAGPDGIPEEHLDE